MNTFTRTKDSVRREGLEHRKAVADRRGAIIARITERKHLRAAASSRTDRRTLVHPSDTAYLSKGNDAA